MRGLFISKEMHEWATEIEKSNGIDRSSFVLLGLVVSKINNFDHIKKIDGMIFKTEIISAGLNIQTQGELKYIVDNVFPGLKKEDISSLIDQGLRHIKEDIESDQSIDIFEHLANLINKINQ